MYQEREFKAAFGSAYAHVGGDALFDRSWPSHAPWSAEPLDVDEVFYTYDGPIFFSVRFGPMKLLLMKVNETDDRDLYLASLVTDEVTEAMAENRISVRGAILSGLRYMVETVDGYTVTRYWDIRQGNVSDAWISAPGVCLTDPSAKASDDAVFAHVDGRLRLVAPGDGVAGARFVEITRQGVTLTVAAGSAALGSLWSLLSGFLPRLARARHRKRGTVYDLVFPSASVQAETPIVEGDEVVVYVGEDGRPWVRKVDEFQDGRFEKA